MDIKYSSILDTTGTETSMDFTYVVSTRVWCIHQAMLTGIIHRIFE